MSDWTWWAIFLGLGLAAAVLLLFMVCFAIGVMFYISEQVTKLASRRKRIASEMPATTERDNDHG